MKRSLTVPLLVALFAGTSSIAHAAEALDIVRQAIKAGGGKQKLAKYKAAVLTGTGTAEIQNLKVQFSALWSVAYPDKYRMEVDGRVNGNPFEVTQIVNGQKGWLKLANGRVLEMNENQQKALDIQMQADYTARLVPLLDTKAYTVTLAGELVIDKQKAVGVNVTHKDGLDVNLYFDAESHLLLKQEYPSKDETGKDILQSVYYRKHKTVQGVSVPTQVEIQRDGKTFVKITFSQVELRESLDKNLFQKPSS